MVILGLKSDTLWYFLYKFEIGTNNCDIFCYKNLTNA